MGDRCNVVVRQESFPAADKDGNKLVNDVWYYMHWGGDSYVDKVKAAIRKEWRWTDHGYLARIIFDELVAGNSGTETSFGISTQMADNEHPILVVDGPGQRVFFVDEKELVNNRLPLDYEPKESQTFDGFIGRSETVAQVRKARRAPLDNGGSNA